MDMDSNPKNTRSDIYINFVFGLLLISILEMSWLRFADPVTGQLIKAFPFKGFDPIELRDKLSVALLIAMIPICTTFNFRIRSSRQLKQFLWMAEVPVFLILLISLSWKTLYRPDLPQVMWEGFGKSVAVLSCAIVLLAIAVSKKLLAHRIWVSKKLEFVLKLSVSAFLLVSYLPSVINIPQGVTSVGAMRWSLNELIAPITGKFPLANFTSEYSSLLGFPLLAFKWILPNSQIPLVALMYINFLVVSQFLLMGLIVKKILPSISYLYCLLASCSIPLVQYSANHDFSSTIVSALTATPSRTFLPIVGIVTMIYWNEKPTRGLAIATGSICMLSVINNLEFGLWFGAVVTAVVVWSHFSKNEYFNQNSIPYFYLSLISTLGIYLLSAQIFGGSFDLRRYLVFVRAFGKSDFGSIPMPQFGLYIFIFSILAISASVALKASGWMRLKATSSREGNVAIIVGVVVGLWSSFSLLYYAGRSTNAGQLQIFLIPLPIAIAAAIQLCSRGDNQIHLKNLFLNRPLILLLLCSLPLSSVLQAPSPRNEFDRFTHGQYAWTLDSVKNTPEGYAISEFATMNSSKRIGYFGRYGNLVELALPVDNASSVNFPYDLWMSPLIKEMACRDISKVKFEIIIVPQEDLPENEVSGFCSSAGLIFNGPDASNKLFIYTFSN
jgi:hypothetical protein